MDRHQSIVLVPCHNEEVSIQFTLDNIRRFNPDIFILVIDNCSTDETFEKAKSIANEVIKAPNKGKGFAVRKGFEFVNKREFDVIFMIDGDATYSSKEFQVAGNLITYKNYDMIVGNRLNAFNLSPERRKILNKVHFVGNKLISTLHRILFNTKIDDTLSGWRAFSPGFVRSFTGGASAFEIEAELNVHAFNIHGAVTNINVEYNERMEGSNSKLNTIKDGIKIIRRQLKMFRSERPLIAYTLLGLPWFGISALLMVKVLRKYLETNLVPNFPSLIAGVAAFLVALLLWTTGMILENVRISRISTLYQKYANKY